MKAYNASEKVKTISEIKTFSLGIPRILGKVACLIISTNRIATKLGWLFRQLLACFKTSKYYKKSPDFSTADRVHRALCGHEYFLSGRSLNATVSIICKGAIILFREMKNKRDCDRDYANPDSTVTRAINMW